MNNIPGSWIRGFDAARAASLYSDGQRPGTRMGAALFSGSKLISLGFNTYAKTNPKYKIDGMERKTHAELAAIVARTHYDDRGSLIYVYRQANGVPACSIPCAICFSLIKISGVKRIRCFDKHGRPMEIKI